jgi:alpha-glucuronidase
MKPNWKQHGNLGLIYLTRRTYADYPDCRAKEAIQPFKPYDDNISALYVWLAVRNAVLTAGDRKSFFS